MYLKEIPCFKKAVLRLALLLLASFLLMLCLQTSAFSQPTPWQITADSLIHYKQPESIFAEGNVVLNRPEESGPMPLTIKADWIRYDVERGTIKARGNVSMVSEDEDIVAEAAILDLNTQTGTLTGATLFLAENKIYIKGSEIVKTGEFTYVIEDAWASACRPDGKKRLPWAIRSTKSNLTVDGMAVLKNATFHVKEVPIAYTPYMMFPAKTKRETGVLFPEWSYSSRDGFGLTTPFFINLSPSSDVTLYPGYLTNRGILYGAEFNYMLAQKSFGTFLFSHLRDRLVDTDDLREEYKADGLLRTTKNRYWFRGKADHDFGNSLMARLDIDLVSDQDYLRELQDGAMGFDKSDNNFLNIFGRGLQEETITNRESSLQLIKSWPDMILSGEMRTVQDISSDLRFVDNGDSVLDENDLQRISSSATPLQALPRVEFNGRSFLPNTPLSLAWDTEYVNYWRDKGTGAHRLDLHPQLITSLPRGGWFEGKVTPGVRETLYQVETYGNSTWAFDRFQDRKAFDFEGNLATLLMRDFSLPFGSFQSLEHTVRPNIIYNYITRTQEKELPSLDDVDRLAMKNWLTYELNNYFAVGGTDAEGNFWNRDLGSFKVLQTYNVREARRDIEGINDTRRVLSDIRFDMNAYPLEQLQVRYQTNLSVYGKGINRYELLTRYTSQRGDSLAVDYQYLKNSSMAEPYFYTDSGDSRHDIEATAVARLTQTLFGKAYVNKSFSTDHTVESRVGLIYKPHCWMVELETTRTPGDRRIMVIFSLDGIAENIFRLGKGNV